MVKMKFTFLLITLTLLCTGCVEDTAVVEEDTAVVEENITIIAENTINKDSIEEYSLTTANNAFAFNIYSQLKQLETGSKKISFFRRIAYLPPWRSIMRG